MRICTYYIRRTNIFTFTTLNEPIHFFLMYAPKAGLLGSTEVGEEIVHSVVDNLKKTPYFQPDLVPVGYTVDMHYLRNEYFKPKLALQLRTRCRLWPEKYGMSSPKCSYQY